MFVNKRKLLLFIFSIFSFQLNAEIVEIYENGLLIKKRYYNEDYIIKNIIIFDYTNSNLTSIDSVSFERYLKLSNRSYEDQIENIDCFVKVGDTFIKEFNFSLAKTYEIYLSSLEYLSYCNNKKLSCCNNIDKLAESHIIIESIMDICNIIMANIRNGKLVSDLKKVTIDAESNLTILTYDSINSKFLNFSLLLQSYFYEQLLIKLELSLFENFLKEEKYYFEEGILRKIHTYRNNKIINTVIIINYYNNEINEVKTILYEHK